MSTEFTPTISTDANGDEFVDYENGQLTQRDQFHRGMAPQGFEINEETGEHSVFEEPDPVTANDTYIRDIAAAYPQLPDALTYAHANLSPELMGHFYTAAEDGDLDDFHEFLEIILAEWEEHIDTDATSEIEEETTDVDEVEQELETPDLSSLYQQEPDYELMDTYTDLADKSEGVEQLLYQLSARFHAGGETADELIEIALASGYSRNQLIETFNLLNS